uniref:Uncharacterized protein n=1 Tax=Solanum lycopersicum TaxID=4081 RepID=A0A494G9T9_SOLLC
MICLLWIYIVFWGNTTHTKLRRLFEYSIQLQLKHYVFFLFIIWVLTFWA